MSFIRTAQVQIEENSDANDVQFADEMVVYDDRPTEETVLEVHDELEGAPEHGHEDPNSKFTLPNIPGAPEHAQDDLVVEDQDVEIDEHKDAGPVDAWNPSNHNSFPEYVVERFNAVPKHDGQKELGLRRAIAYFEKLKNEVSRTVQNDVNGAIDIDPITFACDQIDEAISRLQERLEKVTGGKAKKKKKADSNDMMSLVKEGQRATRIGGIIITVPLLISRVARVCINGTVSGGHDIEDLFDRQVKAYGLDICQQAETMQLLADMGYPMRRDRGWMIGEEHDQTSSDNMDFASNYPG